MAKTNTKTNTKAKTTSKTKGGKASSGNGKGRNEEVISRWKIARVIIGMVLMFISVFMILSFSSYIYSGAQDFSFCEGLQNGDVLDESIKIKNAITSQETNKYWGVWFIDRVIFMPHKED